MIDNADAQKLSETDHFFPENFNFYLNQPKQINEFNESYIEETYKDNIEIPTEEFMTLIKYLINLINFQTTLNNDEELCKELVHKVSTYLNPHQVTSLIRNLIENDSSCTQLRAYCSSGWNPFLKIGNKDPAIFGLHTPNMKNFNSDSCNNIFNAIFEGMKMFYIRQLTTSQVTNPLLSYTTKVTDKWRDKSLLQKELDHNDTDDTIINYLLENDKESYKISYKNWPLLNEMILRGNKRGIETLIEQGANPYFRGTRDHDAKIDIEFDKKFPPETIWWTSVNAFSLANLILSPIKENLIQVFMNHCKRNHIARDTYMKQQRHLCECKLCKYHPDYPKPTVYHMGNLAENFGESCPTDDMKLYKDHIERPDYTVKMPECEMFKFNKICKEQDNPERISVETKVEKATNLKTPKWDDNDTPVSPDTAEENSCDCKFLGMNINTKFVLHLPEFCNRFYTDDLTESCDVSIDSQDESEDSKGVITENHSQDYSPWNDKLKLIDFEKDSNST